MSSDSGTGEWAIRASEIGKTYLLYDKPHHRLLQSLWRGRRQYGRGFESLHGVSFDLARGQTLGIIGRNGAGKSTLLQIICGTLAPTGGNVQVQGRVAALLELGTGFNPEFTGRENVLVNAAILGLSNEQVVQRLDDIIAFADIGLFIDQPVKTYSSGMYVRLAFAVVAHVDPDILVVDEALAVGDAMFQAKCMTRMRRMLDDGMTLLFTSHDISAVKALCERTLWLEQGRIRAFGPTAEVTRAYDQDWIREANAAQGVVSAIAEADASASSADAPGADNGAPSVGTGSIRLIAAGWGVDGVLGRQARAAYGEVLGLRVRLRTSQPCQRLIVAYHVKNRQNQHVLGGHTGECPELYARSFDAGEVFDVAFDIPIFLHDGDYALSVLVTSISDLQLYADATFHLWVDDAATLHVPRRTRLPLTDMIELPPTISVARGQSWAILDDFFPNLLTGFRVAEYNAHLAAFPQLRILSSLPDFATEHLRYAQRYPEYAARVQSYAPDWLAGCQLAYLNFLNNAAFFVPELEARGVPFVLCLYPGGGFGLDETESDDKLARVLASPMLRALIATQPVTEQYLRRFAARLGLSLPALHRIDGGVVNALYFEPEPQQRPRFGADKRELDVCFVAERYMARAANKGYPEFVAAARALADVAHLRWHVVGGGFTPNEVELSGLEDHIVFHGRLETPRLRRFFLGMDLIVSPNRPGLLHPGNFDGFPTGGCVEASLTGVAIMATDALAQNPGYVDGESIFLLDLAGQPLEHQIESRVRAILDEPGALERVARAGQALTGQLYAPQHQIGERQRVLREVAGILTREVAESSADAPARAVRPPGRD